MRRRLRRSLSYGVLLFQFLGCGCKSREKDKMPSGPVRDSSNTINGNLAVQRIRSVIEHIDDNPDRAHGDQTPAVQELVEADRDAIEYVLPLMFSENLITRMHAESALRGIMAKMFGFVPGQGWPYEDAAARYQQFWASHGSLSCDDDLAKRKAAVELWQKWIAAGFPLK